MHCHELFKISDITYPTVENFHLYKRKLSELWLMHNPELHGDIYLNSQRLPVPSQYILSLINFIIKNQENFQSSSSIYNINTTNKCHRYTSNASLSCFSKSTFHAGIKIFNNLPCSLTILKNEKTKFIAVLRKYLNTHSFYSVDEFFICRLKMIYNTVS